MVLLSPCTTRMTAKPLRSTYCWLPPAEAVATSRRIGSRWVTWRPGESPFMPVARMTRSYWPGATVPELIVSVDAVPLELGLTLLGENVTAPSPIGRGSPGSASSDNVTPAPPNDGPLRLMFRANVTFADEATNFWDESRVIVKSRSTSPTFTANGWYLMLR